MRRILIAVLSCWTGVAAASGSQMSFDVFLEDKPVGIHRVNIDTSDGEKRIQVEARMDVKLLFFTAYSYRHRADEIWRDGCIVQLDTRTDDNGEQLTVQARSTTDGLRVESDTNSTLIDGCVRTFAYWNPELLRGERLLNPQTGEYERAILTRLDNEPLSFNGKTYGSKRYRLQVGSQYEIELWYAADNSWQALETTVSDGKVLRYLRNGA